MNVPASLSCRKTASRPGLGMGPAGCVNKSEPKGVLPLCLLHLRDLRLQRSHHDFCSLLSLQRSLVVAQSFLNLESLNQETLLHWKPLMAAFCTEVCASLTCQSQACCAISPPQQNETGHVAEACHFQAYPGVFGCPGLFMPKARHVVQAVHELQFRPLGWSMTLLVSL